MDEKLKERLKTAFALSDEQIGKLEAEGVKSESDMALLSFDDIKTISGCGMVIAKKIANEMAKKLEVIDPKATNITPSYDILPSVPEDTSYLEMLKVGGVLKIQPVDVISAMRAAIASQAGLYTLPDRIMKEMERFAETQEEPVGADFFKLQKLITQRNYGEVLAVLEVHGNFVSDKRKKDVIKRININLWSALTDFHKMLVNWVDTWSKGMANPGMALSMLAMATGGGPKVLPPTGMMAPPDTSGLRDEAEAVINRINKVFAGTGIPVARALGWDAMRIRSILEEPTLPAAIGATNKDQMLKMLGISVGADLVRMERNVIRFGLSIMDLPKVGSGAEELSYLGAMYQLGMTIPWDKFSDQKEDRPLMGAGFPEH